MVALLHRFRAHLDATRLFGAPPPPPPPGGAPVAVSGGADSVALLDLLSQVASSYGLSLVVAHADHGIQPVSRSVGQAVSALAEQYPLPFDLAALQLEG